MKVELKKPKRTPSFTTRRRTQSFRKLQRLEQLEQLPPVEIQGTLDRKHELQSAGKKAPVRSWKTFYTGIIIIMVCEAIGTAAIPGLLCQSRVIVKMIVERRADGM
jgi:spectrin beta